MKATYENVNNEVKYVLEFRCTEIFKISFGVVYIKKSCSMGWFNFLHVQMYVDV